MAISTKDKKVFSIDGFRGLDKESKLLKVNRHRASDGENFIIDSDTLKTRPAFKHHDILPFEIGSTDKVLDWYAFRDVTLYLTKNHIYIHDGTNVTTEDGIDVISSGVSSLDLEGYYPFFNEEKDCLFIFNMDGIYVFSIIKNIDGEFDSYVLYELSRKPTNPYNSATQEERHKFFEDLPTPYVPTLFIGDNRFEDVNLLSKKGKYQLFASEKANAEGKTIYTLPTVYDPKKHGSYGFYIEFYQGKFSDHGIYPIFLGIEGENFTPETSIAVDYGEILNDDAIEIEDTFYPEKEFEYFVDEADPPNVTPIAELFGLTKEWLFKSKIKNVDKPVFTYLLDFINNDQSRTTPEIDGANKTYKFSVPVKYTTVYKNETTDYIVQKKTEKTVIDVYVQFRLFATDTVEFIDRFSYESQKITEYTLTNPYPEYPPVDETGKTVILLSDGQPIEKQGYSLNTFLNMAIDYLKRNRNTYEDMEELVVKAKLYDGASDVQDQYVNPETNNDNWVFKRETVLENGNVQTSEKKVEYTLTNEYPDYPYVTGTYTEIDLTPTPEMKAGYTSADFLALVDDYMANNADTHGADENLKFLARFYEEETESQPQNITLDSKQDWIFKLEPKIGASDIYTSDKVVTQNYSDPYPAYPDVGTTGYTVIDLPNIPILEDNFTTSHFQQLCEQYVNNNKDSFSDGEMIKFRGKFYQITTSSSPENVDMSSTDWIFKELDALINEEKAFSDKVDSFSYPPYPSLSTTDRTVVELGEEEKTNFDESDFLNECEDYFTNNYSSLVDGALYQFKKRYYWTETEVLYHVFVDQNGTQTDSFDISSNSYSEFPSPPSDYFTDSSTDLVVDVVTNTAHESGEDPDCQARVNNVMDAIENNQMLSGYSSCSMMMPCTIRVIFPVASTLMDGGVPVSPMQYNGYWAWFDMDYYLMNNTAEHKQSFVANYEVQKGVYNKKDITIDNEATFPSYPNFDALGNQVVNYGIVYTGTSATLDLTSPVIKSAIETAISNNMNLLDYDNATAYAKVRIQTTDGTDKEGYTLVAPFTYQKAGQNESQERQSMIMLANMDSIIYEKDDITLDNETNFPDYPSFPNPDNDQVLELGIVHTDTVENINYNDATLLSNIETAISNNIASLTEIAGNAFAKVRIQTSYNSGADVKGISVVVGFEYNKENDTPYQLRQSMIYTADTASIIKRKTVTYDDQTTFPSYPTFDNPNTLEVLDLGIVYTTSNEYINYSSSDLQNAIESEIVSRIDELTNESGNGFAKFRIQSSFDSTGVSAVADFYYEKHVDTPYENRQSFVLETKVDKSQKMAEEGVYEYEYDEDEKAFVVKVRDYFFDYNDEPNINVTISFENKTDYEKVIKNKFGVAFGSENRLFLAGHPDYPNIDRFNVSNDLLGKNERNQSYESTFFPSKNYRVIGGKGAINGYVVATDTHLYITKEKYATDERFFIRQRVMDDNGVVGYNEFKTSIKETPLNHRCIVRFYNDILMLTENGLFGIELSNNVLTDERLVKLRSKYLKKEIKQQVDKIDREKAFILENDMHLYMFLGTTIYMADHRYVVQDEEGMVNDMVYEMVKWKTNIPYRKGHISRNELLTISEDGKAVYKLTEEENADDHMVRHNNLLYSYTVQGSDSMAFMLPDEYLYLLENPEKYTFTFRSGFKLLGLRAVDYHIEGNKVYVDNSIAFRSIQDGDSVYFKEADGVGYVQRVVEGYDENGVSFTYDDNLDLDLSKIYIKIADKPLRISTVFEFDNQLYFRLSPHEPEDVVRVEPDTGEGTNEYLARLYPHLVDYEDYEFLTEGLQSVDINTPNTINLRWVSGITDLGNRLMEKTMFRANVYATRKEEGNDVSFGYKTMRKSDYNAKTITDISNPSDFSFIDFSHFGLSTFSEFGSSFPLKERNFLYIQFEILGKGKIELNSIEVIYKMNRQIKSIS